MKTLNFTIIIMVFCVRAFSYNNITALDSIGLEYANGKAFVIHQVKPDETLYRLLRKYNCTSGEVLSANPGLKSSTIIYSGQILKFPTSKSSQRINHDTAIANPPINTETKKTTGNITKISANVVHVVKPNETLFSIARQYGKSVETLATKNNLNGSSIKVGQQLVISEDLTAKTKEEKVFISENRKVSELGIAEIIKSDRKNDRLLALHRTAPVGSYIIVKNEATGNKVNVKVIGKLPETGDNHDVMVRLSPAAFHRLNPKDYRIRATVIYEASAKINNGK